MNWRNLIQEIAEIIKHKEAEKEVYGSSMKTLWRNTFLKCNKCNTDYMDMVKGLAQSRKKVNKEEIRKVKKALTKASKGKRVKYGPVVGIMDPTKYLRKPDENDPKKKRK